MTADEWKKLFTEEGFADVYVWEDGPGAHYPEHVHETDNAHAILSGEMVMRMKGAEKTLHIGDRIDIPAHTKHSATMGVEGCRYVVGE